MSNTPHLDDYLERRIAYGELKSKLRHAMKMCLYTEYKKGDDCLHIATSSEPLDYFDDLIYLVNQHVTKAQIETVYQAVGAAKIGMDITEWGTHRIAELQKGNQ